MEKTVNFNLNKPEAGDPMRLADFNENADIMDAALGVLTGRAKVVAGSFKGDNTSGRTLELGFTPQFVLIVSKLNSAPRMTIATPGMGLYMSKDVFVADDSRCVENGVYIDSNANNSAEGNYYLAVE